MSRRIECPKCGAFNKPGTVCNCVEPEKRQKGQNREIVNFDQAREKELNRIEREDQNSL